MMNAPLSCLWLSSILNTEHLFNFHNLFIFIGLCKWTLPVWSLQTGKLFEDFNFKHPSAVQCVKISSTRVYSSCDRGLIKIWNTENAALLRVRTFTNYFFISNYTVWFLIIAANTFTHFVALLITFLKVIDAHRSSVKCLFFDKWHLLSGDYNGQVMAWSINCDAKECLITFNHPK